MAITPRAASTPALTTLWTSPDSCSTDWTYFKASGTYYTYISQDPGVTTKDTPCRVPGWGIQQGTFSPGVCPYQWTTWTSTTINGSITSAQCCPSGYINQFSDCASLYSTTMTSVTIYTSYSDTPIIGDAPPGTAVLSAVYVLYQASDLAELPTAANATDTSSQTATTATGSLPSSTSSLATGGGGNSAGGSGNGGSSNSSGLGVGAIAGIAVGAVVAALLLVAGAWYVWRLRRRLAKMERAGGQDGNSGGAAELHADGGGPRELAPQEKAVEAGGGPDVASPAEMPGTGRQDGFGPPVELQGQGPGYVPPVEMQG